MAPLFYQAALAVVATLAAQVLGDMYGSQSITPHDYQSLGSYLAASAPSCGYPYVSLDISRITAVQLMDVSTECGTCLRIETPASNYITDGTAIGLPEIAMATHFAATTSKFDPLPTTALAARQLSPRNSDDVRYVYVLAVDTGGRGLDLAQVSFTALFGQSLSPMGAAWFPVDAKYCEDIWRNSTKRQTMSPTSMDDVAVRTGRSLAPPGLAPVRDSGSTGDAARASMPLLSLTISGITALLANTVF
ncbi:hypothetical protein IWW50_001129 [Coemansia erecta]|nr:hypothetical protein IWW50_001129 [Coemansia erecta]